jgi:hypothetical protein
MTEPHFRDYLPFEEDLTLYLNNLKFPLPKDDLCQVWLKLICWFWRRRFYFYINKCKYGFPYCGPSRPLGTNHHDVNNSICLFVYSCTRNFSAIWRLSPLPVTGLQILAYARRSWPFFIVPHLLRHGTSVYPVSSEIPTPTSHRVHYIRKFACTSHEWPFMCVSQQAWHDKDPSMLKGPKRWV